jgi:hypothetical protein
MTDVNMAIQLHETTFANYNDNTAAVTACKVAGNTAGWTDSMQHYYCTLPGDSTYKSKNGQQDPPMRSCFTFSVRGMKGYTKRSYSDAYDFCSRSGSPLEWVRLTEDAVFRAVMLDRKF